MKTLVILNDSPYGTERSYNALRLAGSLAKRAATDLRVFLMGDAAACAKDGQSVAEGYYNMNRMLRVLTNKHVRVGTCGTCMDARGISTDELVEGATRSSLEELADWTVWADQVIVF